MSLVALVNKGFKRLAVKYKTKLTKLSPSLGTSYLMVIGNLDKTESKKTLEQFSDLVAKLADLIHFCFPGLP